MNYLYFIFMTLILSVSSFVTSNNFQPTKNGGWYEFFIAIGVISAIVTLIIFMISIVNTLHTKQNFRSKCNSIRKLRKDIDNLTNEIQKYKTEFKEIITEMYPQYEKEVFKNMQPQDFESLTSIMIKYPELKFDGILNGYVDKINALFNKIMDKQSYITEYYSEAKDIQEDKWLFGSVEFPSDIENN
jgi:hypothetical protein